MILSQLDGVDAQRQQLTSSESTPDQQREHRVIPLASKRLSLRAGEQSLALLGSQPVPHPNSDPANSLHSANAGGQFRTKQAGVGSLESKPQTAASRRLMVAGA